MIVLLECFVNCVVSSKVMIVLLECFDKVAVCILILSAYSYVMPIANKEHTIFCTRLIPHAKFVHPKRHWLVLLLCLMEKSVGGSLMLIFSTARSLPGAVSTMEGGRLYRKVEFHCNKFIVACNSFVIINYYYKLKYWYVASVVRLLPQAFV